MTLERTCLLSIALDWVLLTSALQPRRVDDATMRRRLQALVRQPNHYRGSEKNTRVMHALAPFVISKSSQRRMYSYFLDKFRHSPSQLHFEFKKSSRIPVRAEKVPSLHPCTTARQPSVCWRHQLRTTSGPPFHPL